MALPSGIGVAVGRYVSPNLAVPWVDTHPNYDAVQGTRWRQRAVGFLEVALPSGIGIAVGMYVSPRFTVPRVIGSVAEQLWLRCVLMLHCTISKLWRSSCDALCCAIVTCHCCVGSSAQAHCALG